MIFCAEEGIQLLYEKKGLCCGCSACYDICPQSAIKMIEDNEGFYYPNIDSSKCINCGLCEVICPTHNLKRNLTKSEAFAAYYLKENIRLMSSSGGIFSALADYVLTNNGVVYGAAFDVNFEVSHSRITDKSDLNKLRGSKYVQSDCTGIYKQCRNDLNDEKLVLFTGTPCQVEALKKFLIKEYENLITIDLACHGVPSRLVWRKYVKRISAINKLPIKNINFRVKDKSWKRYSIRFSFDDNTTYIKDVNQEPFMIGFLQNLYLRPSCYQCQFKSIERVSDITIADFWGVENNYPELDDDKGISLIIIHSNQGTKLLKAIKRSIFIKSVDLDCAIKYNLAIVKASEVNSKRAAFFSAMEETSDIISLINSFTKISLFKRLKRKLLNIKSKL